MASWGSMRPSLMRSSRVSVNESPRLYHISSKQSASAQILRLPTPFEPGMYVADARNSGCTCYRGRARSMLESSCLRLVVVVRLRWVEMRRFI